MSRHFVAFVVSIIVLALSGCAHDKLLRLETAEYATAAKDAQSRGRAFYDGLIRQDREIWLTLNQYDSHCTPESMSGSYTLSKPTKGRLCSSTPERKGQQPLASLRRSEYATQYAALSFIGHYLDGLAKASVDPELGGKEDFVAALGDLNTLLSAFGKSGINEAQTNAVGELVDFVEQMTKERQSADDIRGIVAERRDRVDFAFRQLILSLKRDKQDELAAAAVKTLADLVAATDAKGVTNAAARRRTMELHFLAEDEKQRVADCASAADGDQIEGLRLSERDLCAYPEAGMMLAAWRAHRAFLDLVDGRLSTKQKARLVHLQRENFMRMVKLYLQFAALV